MTSEFKYFAFISYSHADEGVSRWLHRALETYRVPRRLIGQATDLGPIPPKLVPVFRDREELTGAADLSRKVTAALDASRHLIVICSPAAARSRWVDEEVRTFKRMGRGDRVLTLIVDGEPNASERPGEEAQECFVPSLRYELDADGNLSATPAQPIAADLRPGKDGRSNAKLKLVSGLLGIGLDDLKQREQRRHQKRLLLVTAASLAGMLVAGTLAVTAWLARQDAIRNREQAEDLIGFMLGDFRQQLEPLGKLELLRIVGDKALAYFSSQNTRDVTDESLLKRAEALRQIGDVRLSLGEFGPALAAFQESLGLSQVLSARSPDNQDWLFALGNAWFWVGYTHWQAGDLNAAVVPMQEYLAAAQQLVQLDPGSRQWQLERGYAFGNLGALAFARGDSDAALRHYASARDLVEPLLGDAPDDVELWRSLIEFHSWLGSIRESRGELRAALELHARTLQLTHELLLRHPDDRRLWEEDVLRRGLYGNVLLMTGQADEASGVLGDAVTRMRTLAALDPANAAWQRQLASVLERKARVLAATDGCAAAMPLIEEGVRISAELVSKAAEMNNAERTRFALVNDQAACLLELGRVSESRRVLEDLLGTAVAPDETRVYFAAHASSMAMSRYLLGRAWSAAGQPDVARQHWEAGLALLEPPRTDPVYVAARVLLLQALGRGAEAQPIHARLTSQGYAEPEYLAQLAAVTAGR